MSKELPYFKFEPAEWLAGDITACSISAQGLFVNICCLYWIKDCNLSLAIAKQKYTNCQTEFIELQNLEIIKIENEKIKIAFLDLQFNERIQISEKRSKIGALGGIAKAKQKLSKSIPIANIREEKRREEKREDKKREEEKKIYIAFGEFKRIKLTQDEYKRLVDEFGEQNIQDNIKSLDEYIEANNNKNKYHNWNLVLRKSIKENWFKQKPKQQEQTKQPLTVEQLAIETKKLIAANGGVYD